LPNEFPTLDDAIDFVRRKRELPVDEYYKAPKPVLAEAARRAAGWIRTIDAAK
jgi:hypothetical protein